MSWLGTIGKVATPVLYAAVGALIGYGIKEALDNRPGDLRCSVTGLVEQRYSWIRLDTHDSIQIKKEGTRYALRLALVSLHRDFNVRSCSVRIKYSEADKPMDGVLYRKSCDVYDFPDGSKKTLAYPPAQNILALTSLERGKPFDCFATLLVEHPPQLWESTRQRPVDFQWLELRFSDFAGRSGSITIREGDIDPSRLFADPGIWRNPTSEESALIARE
jgi:hypothetical protein